jgi:hypothetical protein
MLNRAKWKGTLWDAFRECARRGHEVQRKKRAKMTPNQLAEANANLAARAFRAGATTNGQPLPIIFMLDDKGKFTPGIKRKPPE